MKYFSTRNKSLNFSFRDIFLRGLAPDGGLFLPSEIRKYSESELKNLSKLSYVNLATEIIFNFCKDDINKNQLKILIEKAYSNFKNKEIVELKNEIKRLNSRIQRLEKEKNDRSKRQPACREV